MTTHAVCNIKIADLRTATVPIIKKLYRATVKVDIINNVSLRQPVVAGKGLNCCC
jgi:hypothetical protein